MKIAMVCQLFDPALAAERLYRAINRYTKHSCRLVVGRKTILKGEDGKDFQFNRTEDVMLSGWEEVRKVEQLLKDMDIIHFHDVDWAYDTGPPSINWKAVLPGKKLVWHGHGGAWLLNPGEKTRTCREAGATMVTCSALDAVVAPEVRWMPNVVELEKIRVADRDWDEKIKVGMAAFKGGQLYKGVGVWKEYIFDWIPNREAFEFRIVWGVRNEECLKRRSGDHITIDNITQGFHGLAGLEGLAMGHAVIVRLDPVVKQGWEERFPGLPMIDVVGMDHAAQWLTKLEKDRNLLKDTALGGRDWMDKHFTEKQIAEEWINLYESLESASTGKVQVSVKRPELRKMFDGVPEQEHPLDGIMGNHEESELDLIEAERVLNQFDLQHRDFVLDAGCGVGRLIPAYKRMGFRKIAGVDFSPRMLEEARRDFPDCEFYEADLLDLSVFEDHHFDVTMLVYVLIHITTEDDIRRLAAEVERVTRHDIIIGQIMDPEHKADSSHCKTWEVFELLRFFRRKRLNKFYKGAYTIKAPGEERQQPVSFMQLCEATEIETGTLSDE